MRIIYIYVIKKFILQFLVVELLCKVIILCLLSVLQFCRLRKMPVGFVHIGRREGQNHLLCIYPPPKKNIYIYIITKYKFEVNWKLMDKRTLLNSYKFQSITLLLLEKFTYSKFKSCRRILFCVTAWKFTLCSIKVPWSHYEHSNLARNTPIKFIQQSSQ